MSALTSFKSAKSLHDVAAILGFKPKSLSFLLYKKPVQLRYSEFTLEKRTGGTRLISCPSPDLMYLQRELSEKLQNCIEEINEKRGVTSTLSHGFKRKHSIVSHASVHRGRRFVFNVDLNDFFGTLNFGRIRGFFIKNRNFELRPEVATILSQIACHNNRLPQGAPSSPVLSNLLAHPLDIHLAKMARDTGCTYSRYADDLTFSTNLRVFPPEIARREDGEDNAWLIGPELSRIVVRAGFDFNPSKTRMQYKDSRQEVTGLVVNAKVNVRSEYRRNARAMAHKLFSTGLFHSPGSPSGTLNQLGGILNFINDIDRRNWKNGGQDTTELESKERLYRRFLLYKDFYAASKPVLLCEGKTDNSYIQRAIQKLNGLHPLLSSTAAKGGVELAVRIYKYTDTNTGRILGMNGGTGDLGTFLRTYLKESRKFHSAGAKQPVVLIVDNDDGATGKGGIYNTIKDLTGAKPDGTAKHYFIGQNVYVVPTPLLNGGAQSAIESFFDDATRDEELGGKKFYIGNKGFDATKHYGKHYFAEHVIKKKADAIDFSGFSELLTRIESVIQLHRSKH